MSKLILLDSGPLGIFSNPGKSQIISDRRAWAEKHQQHANESAALILHKSPVQAKKLPAHTELAITDELL